MSNSPPNPQADKFREMARELEADEDPAHFERVARQIVDAPVPAKDVKVKGRFDAKGRPLAR
jgi:hypothetical protein